MNDATNCGDIVKLIFFIAAFLCGKNYVILKRCNMKNNENDYTTQLRSDYILTKKNNSDQRRRPFNPGDPNEFLFMTAAPAIGEENKMLFPASTSLLIEQLQTQVRFY